MHAQNNAPVFRLDASPIRLRVAADDRVTAVAASHGTVWAGTERGRLFRYDGSTGELSEARGVLSGGSSVRHIYADPRTRAALVFVTSADAFHARAVGPLRPRLLTRLRGLRCTAATWVPGGAKGNRQRNAALLGSALGSLFMLTFDDDNERDDAVERLWATPDDERIDGVRVERVAGKLVGVVATSTKVYIFHDAATPKELFAENTVAAVQREINTSASDLSEPARTLPAELHFMSGDAALASRRFVWAGCAGVTHAQLAVRRRRVARATSPPKSASPTRTAAPAAAAVVASLMDKAALSWGVLKDASGIGAPLAVNIAAWHVLVLYEDSVYAFNHISGALTQRFDVHSLSAELRETRDEADPDVHRVVEPALLATRAAGLARDVVQDVLWIYSEDGELARIVATEAQNRDAWRAATDVGRFDLAMALAPLVARSGAAADADAVATTRQAVLRAQAEHAASGGNWEAAATLFAKTEKPLEEVILAIVDAAQRENGTSTSDPNAAPIETGKKAKMVSYIIEYLVRKLDQVDNSRHTQRALIATVLVQLYAGRVSAEMEDGHREILRKDFQNFLADHHADLDVRTALSILVRHGCLDEAHALAKLASKPVLALQSAVQRLNVDEAVRLLAEARARGDTDAATDAAGALSRTLVHEAPASVTGVLAHAATADEAPVVVDHLSLLSSLMRSVRAQPTAEARKEAYDAAISHARKQLATTEAGSMTWSELLKFLFASHADQHDEIGARRTAEDALNAQPEHVLRSEAASCALSCALRSCLSARFWRVAVHLYVLLNQAEAAVTLALDVDPQLAEKTLASAALSPSKKKALWKLVAAKSDDPVAVTARSNAVLAVHDVLDGMQPFTVASERVKRAVASELLQNRRVTTTAHADAQAATAATDRLRADLQRARDWRGSRSNDAVLACGHPPPPNDDAYKMECARCGRHVIDTLDAPFEDPVLELVTN